MSPHKFPPHLVTKLGIKCCSECGKSFAKDVKPSLSKAFAEHVRKGHAEAKAAKAKG